MSSANFKKNKDFFSKLWEFINLILILILIFSYFCEHGACILSRRVGYIFLHCKVCRRVGIHTTTECSEVELVYIPQLYATVSKRVDIHTTSKWYQGEFVNILYNKCMVSRRESVHPTTIDYDCMVCTRVGVHTTTVWCVGEWVYIPRLYGV